MWSWSSSWVLSNVEDLDMVPEMQRANRLHWKNYGCKWTSVACAMQTPVFEQWPAFCHQFRWQVPGTSYVFTLDSLQNLFLGGPEMQALAARAPVPSPQPPSATDLAVVTSAALDDPRRRTTCQRIVRGMVVFAVTTCHAVIARNELGLSKGKSLSYVDSLGALVTLQPFMSKTPCFTFFCARKFRSMSLCQVCRYRPAAFSVLQALSK